MCCVMTFALCPIAGEVRSNGCAQMECDSGHASQCVDGAVESYCQCRGGFTPRTCNVTDNIQENKRE